MELHWALLARAAAPKGRSRAPVEGEPCRVQWHSVDLEDRRTVGRPAKPVSVVSNMPPPDSALGVPGRAAEHPSRSSLQHSSTSLSGSAGSVYRGQLRPAEQGGLHRKTKWGKGAKIMAIVDRQGLPVAV